MDNTLLGVLIGGLLAGTPTIVTTILNNRQARRKSFDETAFSIAIKAWESHLELARQASVKGYKATVGDIQGYVIYSILVMDAASRGRMSSAHARKSMEDIHKVMTIIDEFGSMRASGEIKTDPPNSDK